MRISSPQAGFSLLEAAVVIAVLAVLASLLVVKMDHTVEDAQNIAGRASLTTIRDAFNGSAAGPGYVSDMRYLPAFDLTAIHIADLLDPPANPLASPATNPLLFNPGTQRGWRGPYVQNSQLVRNFVVARTGRFPQETDRRDQKDQTFQARHFFLSDYGTPGESALGDQWGNPIVLQIPPASEFHHPSAEERWKFARVVSAGPDGILDTPLDRLAGLLPDNTSVARGDDLVLFLNRADLYEVDEP